MTIQMFFTLAVLFVAPIALAAPSDSGSNEASITLGAFRQSIAQRIEQENRACSVDPLRENLLQKNGSYVANLSSENKEHCLDSLQSVELLRCEKILGLLYRELQITNISDLRMQIGRPHFSNEKLSEKITDRLVEEVQTSRDQTLDRIDKIFNETRCPLLSGFTGFFVKRNLKSNLNSRLDDMQTQLQDTHLIFDREF